MGLRLRKYIKLTLRLHKAGEVYDCLVPIFSFLVRCARLSWLFRQIMSARKYTISYRIVSYWQPQLLLYNFITARQVDNLSHVVSSLSLQTEGNITIRFGWVRHYVSTSPFLSVPHRIVSVSGVSIRETMERNRDKDTRSITEVVSILCSSFGVLYLTAESRY